MSALLHLSGVGKDYAKLDANARPRCALVFDLLARARRSAGVPRARRRLVRARRRRIAGHHRRKRRRQVDAAEDRRRRDHADARRRREHGRVGALLELGSGFHPEYTGLANIDLAAALLGLAPRRDRGQARRRSSPSPTSASTFTIRSSTTRREWSCGSDSPSRPRSTPDILITDEVLAVGDESFQKKCVAWMEGYLAGGGTLLLCSHSMYHIQKLCRSALWLKDGRVERYGPCSRGHARPTSRITRRSTPRAKQPIAAPGGGRRGRVTPIAVARPRPAMRRVAVRAARLTIRGRGVLAATAARRWCSSASCAPTARRCTASAPTWTAWRRRASARTGSRFR